MDRREFLASTTGALGLALAAAPDPAAAAGDPAARFLLSGEGSSRATGYAEANKILTWRDKTHVTWLDSPAEGFRVRIRTLDHATGAWSPAWTVGEVYDNHGGPALAADSQGYLYIAYYPHHHPMRVKRSLRPNDASEWGDPEEVGERLTYPTLVVGPDDTLYLTCRQSNRQEPWVANLYTKKSGGAWEGPRALLQAEATGYAHFMDALAWSPDRKTLHLATRIHDNDPPRGHTVGYLKSADGGVTWTRHDGTPVNLPATAATIDIVEQRREGAGAGLRAAGLAVAPDGTPHILFSSQDAVPNDAWIATPGDGGWKKRLLRDALPAEYAGWSLFTPGGITFTENGALYVVLTTMPPGQQPGASGWGHPHCEVIGFASRDGGATFSAHPITAPDPGVPHWLPNLERATGHNAVPGPPGIIYTAGTRGDKNTDLVANRVHWARFPA